MNKLQAIQELYNLKLQITQMKPFKGRAELIHKIRKLAHNVEIYKMSEKDLNLIVNECTNDFNKITRS